MQELDKYLASVEEREKKATPGEWRFEDGLQGGPSDKVIWSPEHMTGVDEEDDTYNTICTMPNDSYGYACAFYDNGIFIAHSRTDIPRLLEIIREQQSALKHIGETSHLTFMEALQFGDKEGAIKEAIDRGGVARTAIEKVEELCSPSSK